MDTICIEYQAEEVQLTRLEFALIAIEDEAMLLGRPHQLMEVGVMFLFGTLEHHTSSAVLMVPGHCSRMRSILSWNAFWLKFKPNGSLRNRYRPKGLLKVAFILDS